MRDRRRAPRLVGEALAERLVGVLAEDLHRELTTESLVAGPPDLARSARVDALEQRVPARERAATPVESVLRIDGVSARRACGQALWHGWVSRQGLGQGHEGAQSVLEH